MLSFFFRFFFISIFGHATAKGTSNCYFKLSCYIFQCILIFRVFECINKRIACAMQVISPKRQLPQKSGGWSKSLKKKTRRKTEYDKPEMSEPKLTLSNAVSFPKKREHLRPVLARWMTSLPCAIGVHATLHTRK